jgi:hypothetical protein
VSSSRTQRISSNHCTKTGKQILFVGTKNEAKKAVEDGALSIDMPFVGERWVGGVLTNFPEIKKRVALLEDLRAKRENGELSVYTKKERSLIDKDIERLEKNFAGIVTMKEPPAALFHHRPKERVNRSQRKHSSSVFLWSLLQTQTVTSKKLSTQSQVTTVHSQVSTFFVGQIVEAFKAGRAA